MIFAIYQHESVTGIHVSPALLNPSTGVSILKPENQDEWVILGVPRRQSDVTYTALTLFKIGCRLLTNIYSRSYVECLCLGPHHILEDSFEHHLWEDVEKLLK